jgi:hypothetical protein
MTDPPSRQRTPQDDSYCNGATWDLTSGHESQKGARHQDRLADWPSAAMWLWLCKWYSRVAFLLFVPFIFCSFFLLFLSLRYTPVFLARALPISLRVGVIFFLHHSFGLNFFSFYPVLGTKLMRLVWFFKSVGLTVGLFIHLRGHVSMWYVKCNLYVIFWIFWLSVCFLALYLNFSWTMQAPQS